MFGKNWNFLMEQMKHFLIRNAPISLHFYLDFLTFYGNFRIDTIEAIELLAKINRCH